MDTPSTVWNPVSGFAPGTLIAERYEVVSRLGTGGMGLVLKVQDRKLNGQVVAVKLLDPQIHASNPTALPRLVNEVLVARSLTHPNIVRIHDMGETSEGFAYISMEYVEGSSLQDVVQQSEGGGVTLETAVPILVSLLRGVSYAHKQGVIHRDLKPANVLIDAQGHIKIVDFGLARTDEAEMGLTRTGEAVGTPAFMAPEQFRAKKEIDARCDVYSLGVLAYQLMVGKLPFDATTYFDMALLHMNQPMPEFADEAAGIPKWYEDMVHKAGAKEEDDRFQSADEFLAALSEHAPQLVDLAPIFDLPPKQKAPESQTDAIEALETNIESSAVSSVVSDVENMATQIDAESLSETVQEEDFAPIPEKMADTGYRLGTQLSNEQIELVKREVELHSTKKTLNTTLGVVAALIFAGIVGVVVWWTSRAEQRPIVQQRQATPTQTLGSVPTQEVPVPTPVPEESPKAAPVERAEPEPEVVADETPPPVVEETKKEAEKVVKPSPPKTEPKTEVVKPKPKPKEPVKTEVVSRNTRKKRVESADLLAGPRELYQGSLEVFRGSSTSGKSRTLSLDIKRSGDSIEGTARIDGYGTFAVIGKDFGRGLELTLTNASLEFILSGTRRRDTLRGTYTRSGQRQSGKWEATLVD